jgi:predicted NUDIX family NTP pyrophosphohydrolase
MTESAGVVLFRRTTAGVEILLVHPGGPFWANKDTHGWSIPKGEFDPAEEEAQAAAFREFAEELGHRPPSRESAVPLPRFRAGRKAISAWLVEGDLDETTVSSNSFELEWPPKSGRLQSFPEVDRAAWFTLDDAATKLHKGQLPILDLIMDAVGESA